MAQGGAQSNIRLGKRGFQRCLLFGSAWETFSQTLLFFLEITLKLKEKGTKEPADAFLLLAYFCFCALRSSPPKKE
jgi:hypothetical protein